jgi:hypothetical protein
MHREMLALQLERLTGPESMGKLETIPNPLRRGALIVAGCCVLLLGVILLLVNGQPGAECHLKVPRA